MPSGVRLAALLIVVSVATVWAQSQEKPVRIPMPPPGGRVQLDRWVDKDLGVSDPLTQIVRVTRPGGSAGGTGFLLADCRVLTAMHVIAAGANSSESATRELLTTTFDPADLVGERFYYYSQPLAALGGKRVEGDFIVLAHGLSVGTDAVHYNHEDWAVGYDEHCYAERMNLGTIELQWEDLRPEVESRDDLLDFRFLLDDFDRAERRIFTAGFPLIEISGVPDDVHPMYIDSKCQEISRLANTADDRRNFNRFRVLTTDCLTFQGGSGQPLLTPVMDGDRVLRTADGRPRLRALGLLSTGAEVETGDPRTLHTFVAFNAEARKDLTSAIEMRGPALDAILALAPLKDRERKMRNGLKDRRIRGDWAPTASPAFESALAACLGDAFGQLRCEAALTRPDITQVGAATALMARAEKHGLAGHAGEALREINRGLDVMIGTRGTKDELLIQLQLHGLRGELYQSRSLFREAQTEYAKGIEQLTLVLSRLSPFERQQNSAIISRRAELDGGILRDYVSAVEDYDRLVAVAPSADAYNGRCYFLAVVANQPLAPADALARAVADCNRALELQPNDAAILDSRAFAYLKMGRFAEALADYNASLSANPRSPDALFGRGVLKLRMGDAGAGNADIASAKALQPDIEEQFEPRGLTRAPLSGFDTDNAMKGLRQLLTGRSASTGFYTATYKAFEPSGSLLRIRTVYAEAHKPNDTELHYFQLPLKRLSDRMDIKPGGFGDAAILTVSCARSIGTQDPPECFGEATADGNVKNMSTLPLIVPASDANEIAKLLARIIRSTLASSGR